MRRIGNELHVVKYDDPSHGWLAVKTEYVILSNISVSTYSYQRGRTSYLEGDRDAPNWINAMEKRGFVVFIDHRHTDRNSPIRSYDSYRSLASCNAL